MGLTMPSAGPVYSSIPTPLPHTSTTGGGGYVGRGTAWPPSPASLMSEPSSFGAASPSPTTARAWGLLRSAGMLAVHGLGPLKGRIARAAMGTPGTGTGTSTTK